MPQNAIVLPDEEFLSEWVSGKSKKTQVSYKTDIRFFLNFMAQRGLPIETVSSANLREYQDYLRAMIGKELALETVIRRFRVVKAFLNYCEEEGVILQNPGRTMTFVPSPKEFPPPAKPLSRRAQISKGVTKTADLFVRLAAHLLAIPGVRSADLAKVRYCHVFYREGAPHLYLADRNLSVPLSEDAWKILDLLQSGVDSLEQVNAYIFDGLSARQIRALEDSAAQLAVA